MSLENILFIAILIGAAGLFLFNLSRIRANIGLGKDLDRTDRKSDRLNRMMLVAFGQKKMFKDPFPAVLHGFIYVGFLVINIEVLEIVIDGIVPGSHRALSFLGPLYDGLMAVNEVLAALVIVACAILLVRRNVLKIRRYHGKEMSSWPKVDANIILVTEIVLMIMLFMFNVSEIKLSGGHPHAGVFPVSAGLAGMFGDVTATNVGTYMTILKIGWWGHIVGILLFLNYLPFSKHFHIIMAFPNTYFSKLEPKGKLDNVDSITHEIKFMLDPSYKVPEGDGQPQRFGAKDVTDLSWKNLMDAYTCTECGRCTAQCPANLTGKKLSPRKIVMDMRDRMEDLQKAGVKTAEDARKHAEEKGTSLLNDYTTAEELWACTTCNACVEACPVSIDHVSAIVDMRRYLVLEESAAPQELNIMFNNIENNGAPWAMSAGARFDWASGIEMPAEKFAKA